MIDYLTAIAERSAALTYDIRPSFPPMAGDFMRQPLESGTGDLLDAPLESSIELPTALNDRESGLASKSVFRPIKDLEPQNEPSGSEFPVRQIDFASKPSRGERKTHENSGNPIESPVTSIERAVTSIEVTDKPIERADVPIEIAAKPVERVLAPHLAIQEVLDSHTPFEAQTVEGRATSSKALPQKLRSVRTPQDWNAEVTPQTQFVEEIQQQAKNRRPSSEDQRIKYLGLQPAVQKPANLQVIGKSLEVEPESRISRMPATQNPISELYSRPAEVNFTTIQSRSTEQLWKEAYSALDSSSKVEPRDTGKHTDLHVNSISDSSPARIVEVARSVREIIPLVATTPNLPQSIRTSSRYAAPPAVQETVVQVTIGRVEVRAVMGSNKPNATTRVPAGPQTGNLENYLRDGISRRSS